MEMPVPFGFRYKVLFWASPVELATRESHAFMVCDSAGAEQKAAERVAHTIRAHGWGTHELAIGHYKLSP